MALIQWLLVALCAVHVSCFPAEENQQDANVELGRSERFVLPPYRSWSRLKSWGLSSQEEEADNDVDIERVISEIEDTDPWDEQDDVNSMARRQWAQLARPVVQGAIRVSKPIIQQTGKVLAEAGKQFINSAAVQGGINAANGIYNGIKNRLGKRDLTAVESLDTNSDADATDAEEQFVSEAVQKAIVEEGVEQSVQAATPRNIRQLLNEKVIKAEKYELPSRSKTKHNGVVVTLNNGRRLLILKGYEFSRRKSTVVLDAEVMADSWKLLESNDLVENSTLRDYIRANEASYNSRHAARKMMALD